MCPHSLSNQRLELRKISTQSPTGEKFYWNSKSHRDYWMHLRVMKIGYHNSTCRWKQHLITISRSRLKYVPSRTTSRYVLFQVFLSRCVRNAFRFASLSSRSRVAKLLSLSRLPLTSVSPHLLYPDAKGVCRAIGRQTGGCRPALSDNVSRGNPGKE